MGYIHGKKTQANFPEEIEPGNAPLPKETHPAHGYNHEEKNQLKTHERKKCICLGEKRKQRSVRIS